MYILYFLKLFGSAVALILWLLYQLVIKKKRPNSIKSDAVIICSYAVTWVMIGYFLIQHQFVFAYQLS